MKTPKSLIPLPPPNQKYSLPTSSIPPRLLSLHERFTQRQGPDTIRDNRPSCRTKVQSHLRPSVRGSSLPKILQGRVTCPKFQLPVYPHPSSRPLYTNLPCSWPSFLENYVRSSLVQETRRRKKGVVGSLGGGGGRSRLIGKKETISPRKSWSSIPPPLSRR